MQLLVKIKHIFYSNMIEHDRWISCTPTIKIDQKQTKESDQQFIIYRSQDHSNHVSLTNTLVYADAQHIVCKVKL